MSSRPLVKVKTLPERFEAHTSALSTVWRRRGAPASRSLPASPIDLSVTPATPVDAPEPPEWETARRDTWTDNVECNRENIVLAGQDDVFVTSPTDSRFSGRFFGRRKALLIGIRYWRPPAVDASRLDGAHADVEDMKSLLMEHFDWRPSEFRILKDDMLRPEMQPTRANILREIRALVRDAEEGDHLFLHYAGHGVQVVDDDQDEEDTMDEAIVSSDGLSIVDDELHDLLVKPLPEGCKLTAIFDCCHSGTGLDLPEVAAESRYARPPPTRPRRRATLASPTARGFRRLTHRYTLDGFPARPGLRRKDSDGDVVMWSACRDADDAFETRVAGGAVRGAMTYAFVQTLRSERRMTYRGLLDSLSKMLGRDPTHSQVPQLSGSRPIRLDDMFTI